LKEGYWGDVVVFDFNTIADMATPSNPWVPPQGVNVVLVNGQVVWQDNQFTGALPGKVLRRSNN
jgi:N-acyl-D-amino-acid deacylase